MEFVARSAADLDRHRRRVERRNLPPPPSKTMEACVPGKRNNQNQPTQRRLRRRATGDVSMIYSSYCVCPSTKANLNLSTCLTSVRTKNNAFFCLTGLEKHAHSHD